MVKILKYDNPDHKTKLKTQHIQVKVKSTRQINNTGYEWYISSSSIQSPGAPDRVSVISHIIHFRGFKCIESYLQECGRAG